MSRKNRSELLPSNFMGICPIILQAFSLKKVELLLKEGFVGFKDEFAFRTSGQRIRP